MDIFLFGEYFAYKKYLKMSSMNILSFALSLKIACVHFFFSVLPIERRWVKTAW